MLLEYVQSILRPKVVLQLTGFVLKVDRYGAFLNLNEKICSKLIFGSFSGKRGGVVKNRPAPPPPSFSNF